MKTSDFALILACSLLTGCGGLPQRHSPQEAALTNQVVKMVTDYNRRHGTRYAVPSMIFEDRPASPTMIASANYTMWSIRVNKLWIKQDPCLVFKEAVAHELAHLLVYYQEYGEPITVTLQSRTGAHIVAFNGPPMLQNSMDEHGKAWQTMARELGADPCKEGYCYSPRPYSKYPLVCADPSGAKTAVATSSGAMTGSGGR